jgi:hypothetical protein
VVIADANPKRTAAAVCCADCSADRRAAILARLAVIKMVNAVAMIATRHAAPAVDCLEVSAPIAAVVLARLAATTAATVDVLHAPRDVAAGC